MKLWFVIFCILPIIHGNIHEITDSFENIKQKGYKIHYALGNSKYIVSHKHNISHPTSQIHRKKFKFNTVGYQQLLLIAAIDKPEIIIHQILKQLPHKAFTHNHYLPQNDEGIFMIRITNSKFLNDTIYRFINHPSVLWIDFFRVHHKHNIHAAKVGVGGLEHNYTSKNQIITIGDTGLDYNHCYFTSETKPVQLTFNTKNLDILLKTH